MATTSPTGAADDSLYARTTIRPTEPDPKPDVPGTIHTAQVETVDNDRAGLMLEAGVVR